jgi:spore cortex formation protein SpoVR/YcgB (stage V sporulation)
LSRSSGKWSTARDYGLDFFPTIFEVVDADQLNAIAAYGGFPTRIPIGDSGWSTIV